MKVTLKNIKDFLVKRRKNKFYFKFPWLKERQTLIVETQGLFLYHPKFIYEMIVEDALTAAFKAYQKRISNKSLTKEVV